MLDIGSKIRHFRTDKGYSQEDMANLLGMTVKAYSNIERNVNKGIDIERVKQIAETLEVNWLELLSHGEKYTQVNNGDNSSHTNNLNLYATKSSLTHEIEKLGLVIENKDKEIDFLKEKIQSQQTEKNQEIEFLRKEIAFLRTEVENLKEIVALLKENKS